jgi:hypothetical protein
MALHVSAVTDVGLVRLRGRNVILFIYKRALDVYSYIHGVLV